MAWRWLGLDYESFYDPANDYTLRKMDIPSYVLDQRFEATLVAVTEGDRPPFIVDGPDIPRYLADLGDPSDIAVYSHNSLFDASISSWRYNWRPGLHVCTLVLARQLLAHKLRSLSLDSVSKHFGLPLKSHALANAAGLRRADIIARGMWPAYCDYALGDVSNAREILWRLVPQTPVEELVLADSVMRMAIEPKFEFDVDLLAQHLADVQNEKAMLLTTLQQRGVLASKDDLMSNEKFAAALESLGVEPPTKVSPTTGKTTYAFAKSDDGLKALQEHDDPAVQALVAARLGFKTTQEETRTLRYLNCSTLYFPAFNLSNLFPIPLKVSGAHTHRLSGDWGYNAQNLKRGGKLRKAMKAPKGYKVVTADSKQIEARLTATFCEQWDLVEQFRLKQDPYTIMASKIFGFEVTKQNVPERFCGKTCVLSAQYGVGPPRFRAAIKHLSKEQAGVEIALSVEESERIINVYRAETPAITAMRKRLGNIIPMMADPNCNFQLGPITFLYQRILLPSGQYLYYNDLRYDPTDGNWWFTYQGEWSRLYGGKLLENIIQALARIVVMYALLRLRPLVKGMGWVVHQCHDELVMIVLDQYVEQAKLILAQEMNRTVEWMPLLPVDSDIGAGQTYGDAK